MARQTRSSSFVATAAQGGRKATQRERLVAGMIAAANDVGYARANVSVVIEQAGVSRPTLYDYFRDRDDCFLGALDDVYRRLLMRAEVRVAQEAPERALHSALQALIEFAVDEPEAARFLTSEAMTAGPNALSARDNGLTEIGLIVERRQALSPASVPVPDISPRTLIGGAYRLLGARLRRGEPGLSRLLEDLLVWIDGYRLPATEHHWAAMEHGPVPPRSPFVSATPLRAPAALGPGRPRISAAEVAENQRLRILFATATLAAQEGYAGGTVNDILRLASVDGRTFYGQFAGKQEAFIAVHEIGVQQVLWVTGQAFFSGTSWPERVWEAARAFAQFLELNPLIAHVGFVEAYAAGPAAVQRVEDSHLAFTMFLQEGYQHVPQSGLSRLALEAMVMTIFEMVYRQVRTRGCADTESLLARMSFLCLAPFVGADEAARLIEARSGDGA
jgi:AcrR family transcriptional regulator